VFEETFAEVFGDDVGVLSLGENCRDHFPISVFAFVVCCFFNTGTKHNPLQAVCA
jgi:hypothetical protein